MRRGACGTDDEGSILPLVIGYALVALTLVFVCACATSLYLAQKRVDAAADAAALAGADGFALRVDDGTPRAVLTAAAVTEQAAAVVAVEGGIALVSAETPDGVSARVTVEGRWHPPLVSVFVREGVRLTATATSRTALR
ncbi:pilus assembly protein TadG-related protein [Microbacterium sp. SORGH_AS_0888]|uniref:pilus assembly protein TadG-related protein n=1 Tax=Microbacterium sp. SORGH_AS_0888 TaxID=3041791 RepID=UPI0027D9226E|nr:pilus assembly protein TadG-related protein [Microbacterium sp. SORGH_AS_0888]